MPWKECHAMDERLRFVARLLEGEKMAPLCVEFGISRKTGYKITTGTKTAASPPSPIAAGARIVNCARGRCRRPRWGSSRDDDPECAADVRQHNRRRRAGAGSCLPARAHARRTGRSNRARPRVRSHNEHRRCSRWVPCHINEREAIKVTLEF